LIFLFVCAATLLIGAFSNFLLFDVRHQFLITHSFLNLLTKHTGFYGTLSNSFSTSIYNFVNIAYDSLAPFYQALTVLLIILALLFLLPLVNKNRVGARLILIWLFSPFIAFVLLKYNPLYHYFTAIIIPLIILAAFLIDKIYSWKKHAGLLLLILLVWVNLYAYVNYLPGNGNVFFQSTQPDLKYSDQVAVIREIYKQANGKHFYFQSYTIPYWLQEEWQYLFWYYGSNYYGFVPTDQNVKILFVIIQHDQGNATYQNNWLTNTVSTWGVKESEFTFGALRVEKITTNHSL
jgi:hypothetical protein